MKVRWSLSNLSPSLQERQHEGRFRPFVTPDFVFPKRRTVLFVDGCFWHSCPEHGGMPASNRIFWSSKLGRNQARDCFVDDVLCHLGWTVLHVWEHELELPQRLTRWLIRNLDVER
ncbi:MAG: very short patch repair endonuclease [Curvibacter sp.]